MEPRRSAFEFLINLPEKYLIFFHCIKKVIPFTNAPVFLFSFVLMLLICLFGFFSDF